LACSKKGLNQLMPFKGALVASAQPIRSLISRVICEIEFRLNAESDFFADSAECSWFDDHADIVESQILFGRILNLTSQTALSASRNAMQLSTSNFARDECNVLYVSRTLKLDKLACNLMAQASCIDVDRLASGRLDDQEWDRLEIAVGQMLGQQFSAIQTQQIEISLVSDWLRYASSKFDSTPLVILDDALLLPGIRRRMKDGGQSDFVELSRIASSVDALIVVVQHTSMQ
jgi:hypothetical protein